MEGSVEKLSDEESEQYFHKNPREIRIRSIASEQVPPLLFQFTSFSACASL